jgi:hypothetical protein
MRASRLLFAFLVAASSAAAGPVITSVTPSHGPASGGWTVVIQGTGFSNDCSICSAPFLPPDVFFGSTRSDSVSFIGATELRAVAPPHAAGAVSVTVTQDLGETFTLPDAFTYVDDLYDAFDPILFPIFSPPVHGQGGSEFVTTATVWNKTAHTASLYGMDACDFDPPTDPKAPFLLGPGLLEQDLFPECSATPGRLFFVPKGDTSLAAGLRVWEVTRQNENHGVQIPVVRRKDFIDDHLIGLLSVPNNPKFRLTLRVYGLNRGATTVTMFIIGSDGHVLNFKQFPLLHTNDPFSPSYAVFTDFPDPARPGADKLIVMVGIAFGPGDIVPPPTPLWAFITVTNNETQHITTITP